MIPSQLAESLHQIYPLLLAAGVAVAIVPFVIQVTETSESQYVGVPNGELPLLVRITIRINRIGGEWISPFIALGAVFLALLYVYPVFSNSLFEWSFNLIVFTYSALAIAYIGPLFMLPVIRRWTRRTRNEFLRQFEEAQTEDFEDIRKQYNNNDDSGSNNTPSG